jgi:23S rRNA pseudouridine2457 synthase
MDFKYYIFYKPYNVLNQFTKERPEHITLAEFLNVEKDVYPVGRLDKDSEGLLILTNDTSVNEQLLHPRKNHKRTYIVQLENDISSQAIQILTAGTNIKLDSGLYKTQPCHVKKLPKTPVLPERNPPVRFRQNIPTSWALITLTEGKNRQVRKMFASVGFPVLRLVRVQIENLKLGKLEPGKFMSISSEELFEQLNITVQPKKMPPKAPVNAKKSTSNVNEEGTRYTPKSTFKSFRERNKRTRK